MNFKKINTSVMLIALLGLGSFANAKEFIHPLDTLKNTSPNFVDAKVVTYKDRKATLVKVSKEHKGVEEGGCDNCTFLELDINKFQNGVLEIDIAGKPEDNAPAWARGFVGVVFRVNDDRSQFDGFYLRPMNSLEKSPRKEFSSQYFSYPTHPWHVLRKNNPNVYEKFVDVKPGEWAKLRIELDGKKGKFFVNGKEILTVENMFGKTKTGKIGLFTEPETDAYFSNLKLIYK